MPFTLPGPGQVHVNRPLTNLAVAYMQMAGNFVASRVFPPVPVQKQSDVYFEIPREAWFRDEFKERAPGAESAGAVYDVETKSYACRVYAMHHDVADQTRSNADDPLDPDRQATEFVMQKGLIRLETNWVNNFFVTNKWTFEADGANSRSSALDLTGTSNNDVVFWDNSAATPVQDIRLMKTLILERTGYEPNVLVLGRRVYDVLVDHEDILGRFDRGQTRGPAVAMRQTLAQIFEVDEVLVMNGVRNTAQQGATASYNFIGGKHAMLAYRPMGPGLYVPSAGYTFHWTGYAASVEGGVEISRFRMENLKSDRVEGEMAWDQKLISVDLGGFFKDIVN